MNRINKFQKPFAAKINNESKEPIFYLLTRAGLFLSPLAFFWAHVTGITFPVKKKKDYGRSAELNLSISLWIHKYMCIYVSQGITSLYNGAYAGSIALAESS